MKVRLWWKRLIFFLENKSSFAIFDRSRLKDIFHWWAYLFIFSRTSLNFFSSFLVKDLGIFRTLHASTMERLAQIVNGYNYVRKLYLLLQYQLFTFFTLWYKSCYSKSVYCMQKSVEGTAAVNFDIRSDYFNYPN